MSTSGEPSDIPIFWCVDSPGYGGSEINLQRVLRMLGERRNVLIHTPGAAAPLLEYADSCGLRRVPWDPRPNAARHALPGLLRASELVRRLPDGLIVVWAHHPDSNRWLQLALALSGRAFIVVEQLVPANAAAFARSRLSAPIKRFVVRRARCVVVNAASQVEHYRRLFGLKGGVIAIPNSRAIAEIAARADELRADHAFREEQADREAAPVVVCVARLAPEKGHRDLLAAMQLVGRTLPRATTILVGDGPERAALEKLALALGVRVQFAGEVRDVLPWIAAADVFVLSSHVEGLPGALIEAMAAGAPCVTTDIPGNRDLVTDEDCGLLVPVKHPEQIAGAVIRLATDRALSARLAARARAKVAVEYDATLERERWRALLTEYRTGRVSAGLTSTRRASPPSGTSPG